MGGPRSAGRAGGRGGAGWRGAGRGTWMSAVFDGACSRASEYMHDAACSMAVVAVADVSIACSSRAMPWPISPSLYLPSPAKARVLSARAASSFAPQSFCPSSARDLCVASCAYD